MTKDELTALVDLEIRNSVGFYGGKLAEQRRKATAYYLALPEGDLAPPEVEGRSNVIDPFVRNTIEAMLPQLMVKFTGGDSVVEFEATKPGDEPKAKLCTDYLNYLFWKKNRGHTVAETWMRDALLYKNGIVKVWWDTRVEETKEEYKGLTPVELSEVIEDEEIEVTAQTAYPDEEDAKARAQAIQHAQQQMTQAQQSPNGQNAVQMIGQQIAQLESQPPAMLYDLTCQRSKKGGKLCIENVPPEEFLISRRAKSIATAPFVAHRKAMTISDLRSMGYKNLEDLGGEEDNASWNMERVERLSYDDEQPFINFDSSVDESQKQVWVTECYVRVDYDGDGISELRKITKCGTRILDNEEVDIAPFCDIVCIRQPHKFFGLSICDLGQETQKTKTSILRSSLDNLYLDVNGRYFAVEGQVNLDDLLTSRPGGVVRVKQPDMVGRLDQAKGDGQVAMGMLEYMESFGEAATGWTRNTQGNDGKGLTESTATAARIVANRDDMRIDLIARNFAEGFVELFRQMLKCVCQYQDKKLEVHISGQWVDIDPREWRNQFDVNIHVGLGVGDKTQQIQQIMAVIQQQEKVHAIGVANPENIYNASSDLAKLTGQKNGDRYFSDPAKNPPPPPPPPPELIKGQIQAQIEQGKAQATMQIESAKIQAQMAMDQKKAELDAQVEMAKQRAQAEQETLAQQMDAQLQGHKAQLEAQMEAARQTHERMLAQMKEDAENARTQAELNAAAEKAKLDNDTKILIAQIQAQATLASATAAEEGANRQVAAENGTAALAKTLGAMVEKMNAPRTIIRDKNGRATGIQ